MALEKMLSMTEATMELQEKPAVSEEPSLEQLEAEQMALRKQNARQMIAQLREVGQHQKADEIEGLLAQADQAAHGDVSEVKEAPEDVAQSKEVQSVEDEAKEMMADRVEQASISAQECCPEHQMCRLVIFSKTNENASKSSVVL